MAKDYTLKQVSELTGTPHDTLRQQLNRDAKKDKKQRKYPNAYKTECCDSWMIPAKDLNLSNKPSA
jgi:hypothetical protein